jgi:hypothetical protein
VMAFIDGGCGVTASMEACGASDAGSTPAFLPIFPRKIDKRIKTGDTP